MVLLLLYVDNIIIAATYAALVERYAGLQGIPGLQRGATDDVPGFRHQD